MAEPAATGNSAGTEGDAYMSEDGGRPLRGGAHRVIAAIAVGRRGKADRLPEEVLRGERPNGRKPAGEVGVELSPKE